jgi:uncharacterized protein (TIGR02597 family)
MKTKLSFAILAAAFACGAANAQTAYTTPVGYVSLGDTTEGNPAIKAETDVRISIPLEQPAIYSGTISGITGSTITFSGTPNLPDLTTNPHTITVTSGPSAGLIATVTASTTNSVTVEVAFGDSLDDVDLADKITIRPAWTVLGLMGDAFPVQTQLFTLPGSAPLNPAAAVIYEWDGSGWVDTDSGDYADNDILYPNETLIVRNQSDVDIESFVVTGEVLTTNNRIAIAANGAEGADNAISYFSPVDEEVDLSSFTAIANPQDQILGFDNSSAGFNKAASVILEFDGSGWVDTDSGDYAPEFPLGGGRGFIFRRNTAAAAALLTDTPSYLPLN